MYPLSENKSKQPKAQSSQNRNKQKLTVNKVGENKKSTKL